MRLRFSIRDLHWLTLVVALAAGWWVDTKPNRAIPPLISAAPDYDHEKVRVAVKDFIREALDSDDPFSKLHIYLSQLATDDWPEGDIDAVRRTCSYVLDIIYDTWIE